MVFCTVISNRFSHDTASVQVIQVVKIDVSLDIIPIDIDKNLKFNYPNYSRSILFEPPCDNLSA